MQLRNEILLCKNLLHQCRLKKIWKVSFLSQLSASVVQILSALWSSFFHSYDTIQKPAWPPDAVAFWFEDQECREALNGSCVVWGTRVNVWGVVMLHQLWALNTNACMPLVNLLCVAYKGHIQSSLKCGALAAAPFEVRSPPTQGLLLPLHLGQPLPWSYYTCLCFWLQTTETNAS